MYPPDDRAANDPADPDRRDRRRAVVAAGHRGDEATARSGLVDHDPVVRASALAALTRCDALSSEDLAAATSDPDAGVRRRAAQLAPRAGGLPVAEAEHQLLGLLEDPDVTVAEMAAFALGELPRPADERLVALHAVATGHHDALCRESAVAALGALGDPRSLPTVIEACSDRATVRRRAVLALAAFEGPEVTSTLRRLCEDRDLQVSQAATDLLQIETGEAT